MKKILLRALVAMVLVACAKEETSIVKIEEVKNPYEVTPDEAVQLLQTVVGGESTRAVSVGSIQTLKKSDFVPTTRGAEDGDVVYIVDLEDGGSAIMGADKRMEPIYAILDETKISPEQLTLTATRSDDGEQDIEEYVMGLVNDKITYDMSEMIPIVRDSLLPEMPMIPRPHEVTITTMLGSKYPMLRTKWHQGSPFNDLNPFGLDAGCGPVAIAQIAYYFRVPIFYLDSYLDWNLISECEYLGNPSDAANYEVAKLLYVIGGQVCNWDNTEFGPSPSANIYKCRNSISGLMDSPAEVRGYNYTEIINLLNSGKPVYTDGSDSEKQKGHAWVIDGYKSYNEKIYEREYNGIIVGEYIDTLLSDTTYYLVHCNYGWTGMCDGYYTSGVFDISNELDDDMIEESIGDYDGAQDYDFSGVVKYIRY